jgi:hypothetical protein
MKYSQLRQIIKEEIRKVLNENEIIDKILDKISSYGVDSLTIKEKEYLDQNSKGILNTKDPHQSEQYYSPEVISFIEKLIPSSVPSLELTPISSLPINSQFYTEILNNVPSRIKDFFPLKKGDYEKLDIFMEWLTDKITGGDDYNSYISTVLGITAMDILDQTMATEMLALLNQNKLTNPEITFQYYDALIKKHGLI